MIQQRKFKEDKKKKRKTKERNKILAKADENTKPKKIQLNENPCNERFRLLALLLNTQFPLMCCP